MMSSLLPFNCIKVFLLFIAYHHWVIKANHQGCAVDERINLWIDLESLDSPPEVLLQLMNLTTEEDCYRKCCELKEQGVECNAAAFFPFERIFVCLNLHCQPYNSCLWSEMPLGRAAKVAVYNIPSQSDANSADSTGSNATAASNNAAPTVSGQNDSAVSDALAQQAFEAQVDQIFNTDKPEERWNIESDYEDYYYSTITPEDTNYEWTTESWENTEELTTTGWEDNDNEAVDNGDNENKGSNASGGHRIIAKPPVAHGNMGMYGPSELEDLDYSGVTPLIVLGAVVTVLFLLILLVCVGRKLSERERLQYRPLRDSFPVNNAYHDIEN